MTPRYVVKEPHIIQTEAGPVRVITTPEEWTVFRAWLRSQHTVAVDTETTGLEQYAPDFRVRLVQVATPAECWVLDIETLGDWYRAALVECLLEFPLKLVMHHASYDIQALYPANRYYQKLLWARTTDTRIPAHLIDPRGQEEGGTGHSLEDLAKFYLPELLQGKATEELRDEFLRLKKTHRTHPGITQSQWWQDIGIMCVPEDWEEYSVTKMNAFERKLWREFSSDTVIPKSTPMDELFRAMPIDNEVYLKYAGLDALITARLYVKLMGMPYPGVNLDMMQAEHKLAMVVSLSDARGILLDVPYSEKLAKELGEQERAAKSAAALLGVENISSVPQLSGWLAERGIEVPLTEKGNASVTGDFLVGLMETDHREEVIQLARAVIKGKKKGKERATWVEKFIANADPSGRVHPSTNTLRARTARFSVTGIPAQTLPAKDSTIRGCFVADAGHIIVAVDYSNQELRYVAAVSGDPVMIQAFKEGKDLHLMTAEAAFPGRGKEMRPYGKKTNLSLLYGIGLDKLQKELGLPMSDTRRLKSAFWDTYTGVKNFRDQLSEQAGYDGYITTRTGRKLPVDKDRGYAAINYYVQSGCRDVTARGIVRLYDMRYGENILLPIHDEVLFTFPQDWFNESGDPTPRLAADIRKAMEITIDGVHLPVEIKVGGKSWGSLYKEAEDGV